MDGLENRMVSEGRLFPDGEQPVAGASVVDPLRIWNSVTYDDVHVDFTWEEWTLLDPCQKNLYQTVMLETYMNLTSIGYKWEDHNTEEHCQSSRRRERHEKRQTGEKPSAYTHCVKAFAYDSHLQGHEGTCTGDKPYECNQCGKAFAQQRNLQAHKRIHTGEKPYACDQCERCRSTMKVAWQLVSEMDAISAG
ncbi:zinc finger protein 431 isoform X5 [Cricetulus griseus]|uniref:Zinc finger protein 431 isoform X5 n=1 Tax=Cricetulus griseus TaxID=10029 RepID=A0A9J7H9B5_CRIGR|nr:zinc finger protein 431 isoform X5 [Cricetulus griseus]XP_035314660.1 zinc finger protein 431 isoform X5 [Cricetulus griseus]